MGSNSKIDQMLTHPKFGKLIVNPHTWVEVNHLRDEKGEATPQAALKSPVRGRGASVVPFTGSNQIEEVRGILKTLRSKDSVERLPIESIERFYEWGILIGERELSRPVVYRCLLNDFLKDAADFELSRSAELILNPYLTYRTDGRIPPILSGRLEEVRRLDVKGPTIWVEDPVTRIVSPFGVRSDLKTAFESIYTKKKSVRSLSLLQRKLLHTAGILIDSDSANRTRSTSEYITHRAGPGYRKLGYAKFPYLLNPLQLVTLRRYYWELIEQGWVGMPPDNPKPQRMAMHQEPMGRFFHQQMGPLISMLMDETWRPSYSYWSCYKPGVTLDKHTDRPESGISFSFQIDFKPGTGEDWPLYLEFKDQAGRTTRKALRFKVGECGLFNGIEIPHYREELAADHYGLFLFFFFVPGDYQGPLS